MLVLPKRRQAASLLARRPRKPAGLLADEFVKIRVIRVKFRLLPEKLSPYLTKYNHTNS